MERDPFAQPLLNGRDKSPEGLESCDVVVDEGVPQIPARARRAAWVENSTEKAVQSPGRLLEELRATGTRTIEIPILKLELDAPPRGANGSYVEVDLWGLTDDRSARSAHSVPLLSGRLFGPATLDKLQNAVEVGTVRGLRANDDRRQLPLSLPEDRDPPLSPDGGLDPSTAGHEVWLHIYDLGSVSGRLNEMWLRNVNLGAFHCGVEVLGDEWSFQGFQDAWDNPNLSGIVRNKPQEHSAYIYKESIFMGRVQLSEDCIDRIIDSAMDEWAANSYHIVNRNCVTFAEEFVTTLRVPHHFPEWVKGASESLKAPAIHAIADFGWEFFKWWSTPPSKVEETEAVKEDGRS